MEAGEENDWLNTNTTHLVPEGGGLINIHMYSAIILTQHHLCSILIVIHFNCTRSYFTFDTYVMKTFKVSVGFFFLLYINMCDLSRHIYIYKVENAEHLLKMCMYKYSKWIRIVQSWKMNVVWLKMCFQSAFIIHLKQCFSSASFESCVLERGD